MSAVRQESRLVRPFLNADNIKDALGNVALRIRPGEDPSPSEARIVRPEEAGLVEPALTLFFDPVRVAGFLGKMDIKPKHVNVIVLATANAIRKSEVLAQFGIGDVPVDEIALPKLSKFMMARGGCDLSVILALATELKFEALKPHAFGQWLARKTFALRPERESNEFRILPLTEEHRERLKLPRSCLYFVEHAGSLNDPEAGLEGCVTIWVAETVFGALAKDTSSRPSAAIQKILLAEVIVAIVERELRDLEESLPNRSSPLDTFLKALAKHSKQSPEKLVALMGKDRFRFAAHVQDMLDLSAAVKAAV